MDTTMLELSEEQLQVAEELIALLESSVYCDDRMNRLYFPASSERRKLTELGIKWSDFMTATMLDGTVESYLKHRFPEHSAEIPSFGPTGTTLLLLGVRASQLRLHKGQEWNPLTGENAVNANKGGNSPAASYTGIPFQVIVGLFSGTRGVGYGNHRILTLMKLGLKYAKKGGIQRKTPSKPELDTMIRTAEIR